MHAPKRDRARGHHLSTRPMSVVVTAVTAAGGGAGAGAGATHE